LWTHYFNVGTAGEDTGGSNGVWALEVQEKISRQSINDSTVISPLSFVIYYRKYIDEQLKKAENELNQHTNSFEHLLRSRSLIQTIDISAILRAFFCSKFYCAIIWFTFKYKNKKKKKKKKKERSLLNLRYVVERRVL
jgi:hypothetical protein